MVENGRHMSSCACKLYSVMTSIKCALDTEGVIVKAHCLVAEMRCANRSAFAIPFPDFIDFLLNFQNFDLQ